MHLTVTFLPFSGYRPALKAGEKIDERVSPPYDVIGDAELKQLQSHPHNVTRLTLMPENGRYGKSRKDLDAWISSGALAKDQDSFYLYRQTFKDGGVTKVRTGYVGKLKTEPYEAGHIIPHEETFSKVKADRLNLLRDMEAHLESIFGIFEGFSAPLKSRIAKAAMPLYDYTDPAGVRHEYFRIGDAAVTKAMSEELSAQKMLIADGHHRYETALSYSQENPNDELKAYVLATLVSADDSGLVIWPTHRLIKSDEISEKNAVSKISKRLEVVPAENADDMKAKLGDWQMGLMFRSGKCYLAKAKPSEEPMMSLDTYVVQQEIMYGVYKSDEGKCTVSYDAEYPSAKKKVEAGECDLAVILNDPSLKTIWDLSMKGKRMPKKTTFFYPKIWSGFVFYLMH